MPCKYNLLRFGPGTRSQCGQSPSRKAPQTGIKRRLHTAARARNPNHLSGRPTRLLAPGQVRPHPHGLRHSHKTYQPNREDPAKDTAEGDRSSRGSFPNKSPRSLPALATPLQADFW